ncbi:MAG: alpha/beta fold hydrolase [Elusimicrobia bacterium]|nr:alpha/beta fold hydrolase [Elusimicrobiota bacterium]
MSGSLLAIAAASLLSGCSGFFYYPTPTLYQLPETHGYRYDVVRFPSTDGVELTGILLHASSAPAKGTVVHFHGNAQNISAHFLYSAWLTARGYDVLAFDYRGYGASKGSPTQAAVARDGVAAIDFARARVKGGKLVVWGQSLGGAIAVASLTAGRADDVRAIVLEDTFDSYRSIARHVLASHWWTWPIQWLPWLLVSDRYKPTELAPRLPACRKLLVRAENDEIMPASAGERLFASLSGPKQLWKTPGARHLETFVDSEPRRERLARFLDEALAAP